jgi:hypothetical protein
MCSRENACIVLYKLYYGLFIGAIAKMVRFEILIVKMVHFLRLYKNSPFF